MVSGLITLWQIERKPGISDRFYILRLLCTLGPRRKEQWPHKRLTQTCPWVSRSLLQRRGSAVACCRGRGAECSSACLGPFEGVSIIFINSTIVSPQVKQQGGTQPRLSTETGLKICWTWPRPWEQDPVSPSVSLPIRKLPQASYHYPSEGRQNENHNHRKLTKVITCTTALYNSMKLWIMPGRATQDGWVMSDSSDKTWPTGDGNGKPLQYSWLENPMNSMKRQKSRTLKNELPQVDRCQIWHWRRVEK